LPLHIEIESDNAPALIVDQLATLINGKVPIGPMSYFGLVPVIAGYVGPSFSLRVERRLAGLPRSRYSFRVIGEGRIATTDGGARLTATVDLLARRYLTAYRIVVRSFLVFAELFAVLYAAVSRDLIGAIVLATFVLTFGGIIEFAWRAAERGAVAEAQMLATALANAAAVRN
jgi:cbb3-type cytochrome oxidase subunit 3